MLFTLFHFSEYLKIIDGYDLVVFEQHGDTYTSMLQETSLTADFGKTHSITLDFSISGFLSHFKLQYLVVTYDKDDQSGKLCNI